MGHKVKKIKIDNATYNALMQGMNEGMDLAARTERNMQERDQSSEDALADAITDVDVHEPFQRAKRKNKDKINPPSKLNKSKVDPVLYERKGPVVGSR